ncbi:hypothetical protein QHH03_31385, partial [Aphanizomenon sp. 202]|nr:hypothetical protein [Aphanizomenon sp. 202]
IIVRIIAIIANFFEIDVNKISWVIDVQVCLVIIHGSLNEAFDEIETSLDDVFSVVFRNEVSQKWKSVHQAPAHISCSEEFVEAVHEPA